MLRVMTFCVAFCLSCSLAFGAGIPVIDGTNIIQTTVSANENMAQTLKQIEEYKTQIEQYAKQLEQLKEQMRNGMGFEDLTGQFQGLFDSLGGFQDFASMDGNSLMNQFISGGGGGGGAGLSTANDASSGITVADAANNGLPSGSAFQPTIGPGGTDNRKLVGKFGSTKAYQDMRQDEVRWYVKDGADAVIASTETWMNASGDAQKYVDDNLQPDLERFNTELTAAGDTYFGGTNKILMQLGVIMCKMIELQYMQLALDAKRDLANATINLAANARVMDNEAQALKTRESEDMYQQQKTSTPLTW